MKIPIIVGRNRMVFIYHGPYHTTLDKIHEWCHNTIGVMGEDWYAMPQLKYGQARIKFTSDEQIMLFLLKWK